MGHKQAMIRLKWYNLYMKYVKTRYNGGTQDQYQPAADILVRKIVCGRYFNAGND